MNNEIDGIVTLDTVDSTNAFLFRNPEYLSRNFSAVRSLEQTAGRGRFNREWNSKPGEDLSFSIVFVPEVKLNAVSVVTIYAGLAVFRVLKNILGDGLKLKWPNDVFFNGKKICGILCELAVNAPEKPALIIGIGINVNRLNFPDNISGSSISMRQITGKEHSAGKLALEILDEIKNILKDFRGIPLPENIINEWMSQSVSGEEISYDKEGSSAKGLIRNINSDGTLILKDSITGNELIYSGEILYGA